MMQMVETIASTVSKRHGLPNISILGDPCTGGAIAIIFWVMSLSPTENLVIFTGRGSKSRGFEVDESLVLDSCDYRLIYKHQDCFFDSGSQITSGGI
jgi:hypothetical protein